MLAGSIIAAVTAVLVGVSSRNRWGAWYGTLGAIAGYLLVTITAMALLPSYSEVPADFSATVLYEFGRPPAHSSWRSGPRSGCCRGSCCTGCNPNVQVAEP